MRLLNTQTLQLSEFFDDQAPPYAILSHTWSEEEVTLQDVQQAEPSKLSKKGYEKVQECCRQAQRDGIDWAWMDTCCIDKTSSAELSEAINSMYRWYRNSKRCYAYLSDVDREGKSVEELNKAIEASRWFTRGWTLQELIAPYEVDFFDRYWRDIGSKWSLYDCIYEKTAIPKSILRGDRSALDCSVGERISWAAYRRTTREEDRAYSLLGILGVNMPLLYGEGSQAFFRLQEQILRQCEDYTLLLWNGEVEDGGAVLAKSPDQFVSKFDLRTEAGDTAVEWSNMTQSRLSLTFDPPTVTSRGLKGTFHVKKLAEETILVWTFVTINSLPVCIKLQESGNLWRRVAPECYIIEDNPSEMASTQLLMCIKVVDMTPNLQIAIRKSLLRRDDLPIKVIVRHDVSTYGPGVSDEAGKYGIIVLEQHPPELPVRSTRMEGLDKVKLELDFNHSAPNNQAHRNVLIGAFGFEYSAYGSVDHFVLFIGFIDSGLFCTVNGLPYDVPMKRFMHRWAGRLNLRASTVALSDRSTSMRTFRLQDSTSQYVWIRAKARRDSQLGIVEVSVGP